MIQGMTIDEAMNIKNSGMETIAALPGFKMRLRHCFLSQVAANQIALLYACRGCNQASSTGLSEEE
jgi:hypothetical protein